MDDIDPDILSVPVDEPELDLKLKKLEELILEEESEYDPRWDELKKLMNDN